MRPKHPWRCTIAGFVVLMLCTAAFLYYRLNESLRRNYETIRVVQIVEDYVRTHDGKWPSSWEDLEGTETFKQSSSSLAYFQRYSAVDFSLTSEQLLEKPELIYNAVTPLSGEYLCYPNARRDLDRVLQTIRDARERR